MRQFLKYFHVKPPAIVPLEVVPFRKAVFKILGGQVLVSCLCFLLVFIGREFNSGYLEVMGLVSLIPTNVVFGLRAYYKFEGRLKDLVPEMTRKQIAWFSLVTLSPLFSILFFGFLSRKSKNDLNPRIRDLVFLKGPVLVGVSLFSLGHLPLLFSFIFALKELPQQSMRPIAFWISNPTPYHVTLIVEEAGMMVHGNEINTTPARAPAYEFEAMSDPTITGSVLKTMRIVKHHMKRKNLMVQGWSKNSPLYHQLEQDALLDMTEDLVRFTETVNTNKPVYTQFNPLVWISLTGPMEAGLIGIVERMIELRFLKRFDATLGKILSDDQKTATAEQKERMKKLKDRYEISRFKQEADKSKHSPILFDDK